jgi:hypothetical protein
MSADVWLMGLGAIAAALVTVLALIGAVVFAWLAKGGGR